MWQNNCGIINVLYLHITYRFFSLCLGGESYAHTFHNKLQLHRLCKNVVKRTERSDRLLMMPLILPSFIMVTSSFVAVPREEPLTNSTTVQQNWTVDEHKVDKLHCSKKKRFQLLHFTFLNVDILLSLIKRTPSQRESFLFNIMLLFTLRIVHFTFNHKKLAFFLNTTISQWCCTSRIA